MASRGNTVQLDHMYSADFETCDDLTKELYNLSIHSITGLITLVFPQRVWLAGFKNLETMRSSYYTNIDDFMGRLFARGDNQNIEVAFHNLKFDGSFIIPWLLRRGFTASHTRPEKGQFSVLIDNRNNWYMLTIQATKRRKITIWDSLKLFPVPLREVHTLYGTPTKKIYEPSSFYDLVRGEDHVTTAEELLYFENDLGVLSEALNAHIKMYGLQFKKTQASQAFNQFEQYFKAWKWRFPALHEDMDARMRGAYYGGLSYVNPTHQGHDMDNIGVYDINSSYPFQQATMKLPYGPPVSEYKGDQHPDMSKFWVAEAIVKFDLRKGKLPCIPKKAVVEGIPMDQGKWLASSEGAVVLKFCSIDYLTMNESYQFEIIQWLWTVHFAQKVHEEITEYIHTNNDIKVSYKKMSKTTIDKAASIQYAAMSNRAKINNNAYYGKFGEDIIKEGKTPYLIDNDVEYIEDREELQTPGRRKYLPVAIATTAWGRRQLVTMGNFLGDKFIYCDTDSIHYLEAGGNEIIEAAGKRGDFLINDTDLGAWKYEGHFDRGRYLRSKCYYEESYADLFPEVTLAGLPADKVREEEEELKINFKKRRTCCTWDNFHIGLVIEDGNGKLGSRRTPTGNKLVKTPFEIKENESELYF